jgi:hypothetical protein
MKTRQACAASPGQLSVGLLPKKRASKAGTLDSGDPRVAERPHDLHYRSHSFLTRDRDEMSKPSEAMCISAKRCNSLHPGYRASHFQPTFVGFSKFDTSSLLEGKEADPADKQKVYVT